MEIVKFTAKQLQAAGFSGRRGGTIHGTGYAIKDAAGYISLNGFYPYILQGPRGKAALESIIEAGGFDPAQVSHVSDLPTAPWLTA